jgi:hypothetical protein
MAYVPPEISTLRYFFTVSNGSRTVIVFFWGWGGGGGGVVGVVQNRP